MNARSVGPGAAVLVFVALGAWGALGDHGAGADIDVAAKHLGPSWAHPLGTDGLGRDLLARLALGTRAFFMPGALAVCIAVLGGVGLGALTGYAPEVRALGPGMRLGVRAGQRLVAWAMAVPATLPRFVTVLLASAALGFGPYLLGAVAGLLYVVEIALEVQGRVDGAYREEFVEALRADGVTEAWILGYHVVFLHCRGLVARHACHLWAFVLMLESSLSFMPGEYGIQEPGASWGNMLQRASGDLVLGHYLPAAVPTTAIVALVVALSLLGDRLAESWSGGRSPGRAP